MGDSRLRELERRWQEAETPASWAAYLQEQIRTGTGVVPEAEAFLEGCLAFAETLAPDWRALLIGYVAWGYLDLGQEDRALALAEAAEGETNSLVGCAALTRAAAVVARSGSGLGRFNDALAHASKCLENDDLTGPRHFVVTFLGALDDLGPEARAAIRPDLLQAFLELVPLRLIVGFGEAVVGLDRLGMGPVVGRIRTLLDSEERTAQGIVSSSKQFDHAFLIGTLGTLCLLRRPEDAARAFALAEASPELIQQGAVTAFQRAFAASADAVGAIHDLRHKLEGAHFRAWQWIRLAFLEWAATTAQPPPFASKWLAEALSAVRGDGAPRDEAQAIFLAACGPEIEGRCLSLLGSFWEPEPTLALLREVMSGTGTRDPSPSMVGQLAQAAKGCPPSEASDLLLAGVACLEKALALEQPQRNSPALRALGEITDAAAEVSACAVLEEIEDLVRSAECNHPTRRLCLIVAQMTIVLARAEVGLELGGSLGVLSNFLGDHVDESSGSLVGADLAKRACSLPPFRRVQLGRHALELGREEPSAFHSRDAVDALGALCRDLVGRERSA